MKKHLALAVTTVAAALLPLTNPGPASAAPDDPVPLAAVTVTVESDSESFAGRVFFPGDTAEHGNELWATDGTPAGTRLVVDLVPGAEDSDPEALAVFRGRLYFSAKTASTGQELWSTDGTAAGTQLVADIVPGANGSFPSELVAAGDRLYFTASDVAHGRELWTSDGTAAGTRLVIEIIPGVTGGNPSGLTVLGDRIVYRAFTTMISTKPFVSGPGIPGARQLDPLAFDVSLGVGELFVVGDRVVFGAGDAGTGRELWVSGGQPGDAHVLKDIHAGATGSSPASFASFGGRVLFAARSASDGRELWSTDGTAQGTVLVRDINPAVDDSSDPRDPVVLGDRVVFTAVDGVHGRELWATEGTSASTHMVADTYPGPASGVPLDLATGVAVAGQLLFAGTDARGAEPWVTDGVTPRLVADLAPGVLSSSPQQVGVIGNIVLFSATDGTTEQLYAWTVGEATEVGSTTAMKAKRKYTAAQARKRRIVLPVTVRSTLGVPLSGGTVVLTRNGRTLGTAALVDGTARVRITVRLRPGRTYQVVATWAGDPVAAGSASAPTKLKIKGKHR